MSSSRVVSNFVTFSLNTMVVKKMKKKSWQRKMKRYNLGAMHMQRYVILDKIPRVFFIYGEPKGTII